MSATVPRCMALTCPQVCSKDFFLKTVPLFDGGDDVGMVLSPQCFHNLNLHTDIFNHSNVHFWEYMQPGYDAMGFISCTGTNFLVCPPSLYHNNHTRMPLLFLRTLKKIQMAATKCLLTLYITMAWNVSKEHQGAVGMLPAWAAACLMDSERTLEQWLGPWLAGWLELCAACI